MLPPEGTPSASAPVVAAMTILKEDVITFTVIVVDTRSQKFWWSVGCDYRLLEQIGADEWQRQALWDSGRGTGDNILIAKGGN